MPLHRKIAFCLLKHNKIISVELFSDIDIAVQIWQKDTTYLVKVFRSSLQYIWRKFFPLCLFLLVTKLKTFILILHTYCNTFLLKSIWRICCYIKTSSPSSWAPPECMWDNGYGAEKNGEFGGLSPIWWFPQLSSPFFVTVYWYCLEKLEVDYSK